MFGHGSEDEEADGATKRQGGKRDGLEFSGAAEVPATESLESVLSTFTR